jgi:hypothetical protein
MERSQNGWIASKDRNAIGVKSFTIPGTEIKIALNEKCAPILLAFASEFNKKVEPIEGGQLDEWGYAYRAIRGRTTGLSNHASGTAIDLNATKHPLGKADTFTKPQQKIIRKLCTKYRLGAGMDYKSRPDDMHFEIIDTPEKVTKLIAELGLTKNGTFKKKKSTAEPKGQTA